jgi:hypothetical protein
MSQSSSARSAGSEIDCTRPFFEVREEKEEYGHLVTLPRATRKSSSFMKSTGKQRNPVAAETIARWADQGKDISRFFTNTGGIVPPIQRVNVDFAGPMLRELDQAAKELNVSRQAVIKILIRQALDQHYLATAHHTPAKHK